MARTVAGAALVSLSLVCLASGLSAQESVKLPALSALCDVPSSDIALPEPLPHLANALQSRKPIRVLALGASSFTGGIAGRNYPAQFEKLLEQTFKGLDLVIINRGVSGETAAVTAERLKLQVALDKPDIVLWQVGTNDATARVPVEDFSSTVEQALRWLKSHNVDVVLVGLQYTLASANDEYYTAMRMALRNVAAAQDVLLVRRYEAMQLLQKAAGDGLLSEPAPQSNDASYRCLAEHVARAVAVSVFFRRRPEPPRN